MERWGVYDQWMEDPRVELAAEMRGTEISFRQAMELHGKQSATKAITDCYLVTFDRGLAATARLRNVPVTVLMASGAGHGG